MDVLCSCIHPSYRNASAAARIEAPSFRPATDNRNHNVICSKAVTNPVKVAKRCFENVVVDDATVVVASFLGLFFVTFLVFDLSVLSCLKTVLVAFPLVRTRRVMVYKAAVRPCRHMSGCKRTMSACFCTMCIHLLYSQTIPPTTSYKQKDSAEYEWIR